MDFSTMVDVTKTLTIATDFLVENLNIYISFHEYSNYLIIKSDLENGPTIEFNPETPSSNNDITITARSDEEEAREYLTSDKPYKNLFISLPIKEGNFSTINILNYLGNVYISGGRNIKNLNVRDCNLVISNTTFDNGKINIECPRGMYRNTYSFQPKRESVLLDNVINVDIEIPSNVDITIIDSQINNLRGNSCNYNIIESKVSKLQDDGLIGNNPHTSRDYHNIVNIEESIIENIDIDTDSIINIKKSEIDNLNLITCKNIINLNESIFTRNPKYKTFNIFEGVVNVNKNEFGKIKKSKLFNKYTIYDLEHKHITVKGKVKILEKS